MLNKRQDGLHGSWLAGVAETGPCTGDHFLLESRVRAQLGNQVVAVARDPGLLVRRGGVAACCQALQIQEHLQDSHLHLAVGAAWAGS